MTNDWIIDVLMDLKKFSAKNQLGDLADHLDDTIMIATSELASNRPLVRRLAGDSAEAREISGTAQSGDSA